MIDPAAYTGSVHPLRRFLFLLLAAVASGQAPEGTDLDGLLADYRRYGLELPPAEARLISLQTGRRGTGSGGWQPIEQLCFHLREQEGRSPPKIMAGATVLQGAFGNMYASGDYQFLDPERIDPSSYEVYSGTFHFDFNVMLLTAVQCHARGWSRLADALWTRAASSADVEAHPFRSTATPAQRHGLAGAAWLHYRNRLLECDSDRAKILEHLRMILADVHEPPQDWQDFVADLAATIAPSTALAGTPEAHVDRLVELCEVDGRRDFGVDPLRRRIAELGLGAVPVLMEHLDDNRITRSIERGFNRPVPRLLRIKDVLAAHLYELSGQRPRQGAQTLETVKAWMEEARGTGEEQHLLAHALWGEQREGNPNRTVIIALAARYPESLAQLYLTVLEERPQLITWAFRDEIRASSLPVEEQRMVFQLALEIASPAERNYALDALADLDHDAFTEALLKGLAAIPSRVEGRLWGHPAAMLACRATSSSDPRVWRALADAARRAEVGLRLEILKLCSYHDDGRADDHLQLLAGFLEDTEVRRASSPDDGPIAGFTFRELEVRNFAAMRIAGIIGLDVKPDPTWSDHQWQELRKRVAVQLEARASRR